MHGALPPDTTRRNIRLSAVNQFFVEAAMSLSEATTVLPVFVRLLGGSNFLAGLLPSLRWVGWLSPQFFAAGPLQRMHRLTPTVRFLEWIRSSCYLIIAALILAFGRQHPGAVLAAFFALFMITRFAAGSSAVARNEIIARIVPPTERAALVSLRQLAGGVAGFASGFVVSYVLDERVSSFPQNYATLIGMSGIGFVIALLMWRGVVEPPPQHAPQAGGLGRQIREAPAVLRGDRVYARYILVRAAASGLTLAMPFYILYAVDVLRAPAAMAGVYISTRTLARILSNVFWGRQCRKRGNLWVYRASMALGLVAPAGAVLLALVVSIIWGSGAPSWVAWLFATVFVVQGLSASANRIGQVAYLYDIAPQGQRPTYYGLSNTLLGPLYFLPALGGALLDLVGYVPIFALASLLIGLGLLVSRGLSPQISRD